MKKKKIIIIGGIIVVLIIVAIIVTIILLKKDDSDVTQNSLEDTFLELMDNNYKYYYYMYGDVITNDGYVVIDDTTYYMVNDELIPSINEFNTMVTNTFVDNIVLTLLDVDNKNTYIEINDKIYVNKTANPCQKIKEYSKDHITINDGETERKVDINNPYGLSSSTYMVLEEGTWKLSSNIYFCESEE